MNSDQDFVIKPAKLPSHATFNTYWDKNTGTGWAACLIGYCPDTLPYFMAMGMELKRRLGDLIDVDNITCGKVKKSHYNEGHTIAIVRLKCLERDIPGFHNRGNLDFWY